MIQELLIRLKDEMKAQEESSLSAQAAFSKEHSRFTQEMEDHRLPYKRDVDRIIHSKAYRRYVDKTQVVYLVENDHLTHRSLHVQLVSNFACSVAQLLKLNADLVEAISLGHDVGHPPFGHEGEEYLSEISRSWGLGAFAHPRQSCRLFSEIEPLNLGFAVYDGFLCHDGAMSSPKCEPQWDKDWEDHFKELNGKLTEPNKNFTPATLEGCLVKICDTISYIGKDLEDAISIGIISREDIPQTRLGITNSDILTRVAIDLVEQSYGKDYIALSDETFAALKTLRDFNFNYVYTYPALKVESAKIHHSYRLLMEALLDDVEKKNQNSHLWNYFLHNKPQKYLENSSAEQQVVDYIAGMTDNYFIRTFKKLILPQKIDLTHAFLNN